MKTKEQLQEELVGKQRRFRTILDKHLIENKVYLTSNENHTLFDACIEFLESELASLQGEQEQSEREKISNKLDEWYDFLSGKGKIAHEIACYITDSGKYLRKLSNIKPEPKESQSAEDWLRSYKYTPDLMFSWEWTIRALEQYHKEQMREELVNFYNSLYDNVTEDELEVIKVVVAKYISEHLKNK